MQVIGTDSGGRQPQRPVYSNLLANDMSQQSPETEVGYYA